jgi:release factor glutamine methyltransferase
MVARRAISQEKSPQRERADQRTARPPRDLRNALAEAIICLEAAAVSSAALAAELLLMHVVDRDRAWLYAHPEYSLSVEQQAAFTHLIERRAAGAPTQYLTGHQEFWGLDFEVTPAVLIPRPETEHVIEVALARLNKSNAHKSNAHKLSAHKILQGKRSSGERDDRPLRIADVGTGSGCIAVALAHELPQAQIIATDISAAALAVARRNATLNGVSGRIEFHETNILDYFESLPVLDRPNFDPSAGQALFDLVVSNPPYIALSEAAQLPREVRDHEPHQALFAGEDGLAFYAPLIAQAKALLAPGGFLIVELAHDAAARVRRLLQNPSWTALAIERDLAGIERVLSAERSV